VGQALEYRVPSRPPSDLSNVLQLPFNDSIAPTFKTHTNTSTSDSIVTMDNSPLNKLPAELRNYIYELIVAAEAPIHIMYNSHSEPTVAWIHKPQLSGLPEACRATHRESMQLYYATNKFSFTDFGGQREAKLVQDFCAMTGPTNATALRPVTVKYDYTFDYLDLSDLLEAQVLSMVDLVKRQLHPECRVRLVCAVGCNSMGVDEDEWNDELEVRLNPRRLKRSFVRALGVVKEADAVNGDEVCGELRTLRRKLRTALGEDQWARLS